MADGCTCAICTGKPLPAPFPQPPRSGESRAALAQRIEVFEDPSHVRFHWELWSNLDEREVGR